MLIVPPASIDDWIDGRIPRYSERVSANISDGFE
jgi:hypothetical protein